MLSRPAGLACPRLGFGASRLDVALGDGHGDRSQNRLGVLRADPVQNGRAAAVRVQLEHLALQKVSVGLTTSREKARSLDVLAGDLAGSSVEGLAIVAGGPERLGTRSFRLLGLLRRFGGLRLRSLL